MKGYIKYVLVGFGLVLLTCLLFKGDKSIQIFNSEGNEIMNRIARLDDFTLMEKQLNYIKNIGYHDLNLDAVYKYCRILYCLEKTGYLTINKNEIISSSNNKRKVLDIGGGLSPIHFIISNIDEIHNVDLSFSGWFPVKDNIYINATNKLKYNKDNINYHISDLLAYIKKIPDNYFDYMVDGCSLIHMIRPGDKENNCQIIMEELTRILKPGGHFFAVCDIANPIGKACHDMIYPNDLVKAFGSGGLKIIKPTNYNDWDNYLKNQNNSVKKHPKHFGKEIDKDYPDLKSIMYAPGEVRNGVYVWIGTFVFIK